MRRQLTMPIYLLQKKIESSESQKVQRLTRKLQDQESQLILAEPKLRLTVKTKSSQYCFLLPSDYERREWQEALTSLKRKSKQFNQSLTKTPVTVHKQHDIVLFKLFRFFCFYDEIIQPYR